MRFTSFPSIFALITAPLASPVLAAAATSTTIVTEHRNPNLIQDPYAAFEFNPRHAQWLSQKYNWDAQQNQSHRSIQEQNQIVTDPLGTQFTKDEIHELELTIQKMTPQNTVAELFSPKNAFINACVDNILSPTVLQDDLISQVDVTTFLVTFCINVGTCSQGYTTTFQALSHTLQLSFTRFNCPFRFDGPQDQMCLDELKDQEGDEFGYALAPQEDMTELRKRVRGMCTNFWYFGKDFHGGTEPPTIAPTPTPSLLPTNVPSVLPSLSPTDIPTVSPSSVPTSSPTAMPSVLPTAVPSMHPTSSPSVLPSLTPTDIPSVLPSSVPTSSPTTMPSVLPTAVPSMHPSSSPSVLPSPRPSSGPSVLPSLTPSASPTNDPSASPTDRPSAVPSPSPTLSQLPSPEPTEKPSFIGSFHPSVSVQPSQGPTQSPSSSPSESPSLSPTSTPSSSPSTSPSNDPTSAPTSGPSKSPSVSPSTDPSASPSVSPSSRPSTSPSTRPSTDPSNSPSGSPSDIPSLEPSPSPSDLPTQIPSPSPTVSAKPSLSPSGKPSFIGTWHPSMSVVPTSVPTSSPSASPSDVPSSSPSSIPSVDPTVSPSDLPSSSPSASPSDVPSSSPSSIPSMHPSVFPSVSPSSSPSTRPSSVPSSSPSSIPSVNPSVFPSVSPSSSPSTRPSAVPSSSPTSGPSSSPSTTPSSLPTAEPSHSPTFPPGVTNSPSLSPSDMPSFSPSVSEAPTRTQLPSESPTTTVPFRVDFTYIAGFDSAEISARSLDNSNEDVDIMDDVRNTFRKILALDNITRRRVLRELIGFRSGTPQFSAIYHKDVQNVDVCPESFVESLSCVRIVSEIIVYANEDEYETDVVMGRVRTPIKDSMEGGKLFIQFMTFKSLVEIKYVGDGSVSPGTAAIVPNKRDPISEGGVAGIAVGAIFFVAAIALIAITRSRAEDDREEEPDLQSSDGSYGSDLNPEIEGSWRIDEEPKDVSRAVQIDLETGVVVPAVKSNVPSSSGGSSDYACSDEEGELLIGRLDAAVSAGDWVAVAAIAGDLSTADEASTMTSVNSSAFSDSRSRGNLNKVDAKRAATIDQLIAEGDWNAVGATAAAFDDPSSVSSSSMISEKSSGINTSKNVNGSDGTKRSILDFIAGPWQSSAASKAMVANGDEAGVEELHLNVQSDAISSLSGGLSPDRQRDLEAGVPSATAFTPMMHPGQISESDTTDDDTKPMLGKQQKRGWKGRFTSIRKKSSGDNDYDTAVKSMALQEDSSVSSWSRGSPEIKEFTPYPGKSPNTEEDNIPQEMKAFGEDFGLAAAELAMRQEEEARDIILSEDEGISQKSSNSLRDELDKAIESGDWAAVEAQTNKLFHDVDVKIDDLDSSPRKRSHSASSYEGDSDDNDSREGWSTTSKSMASVHSEPIDDDRIIMLEQLIETDDWQGIVSNSRIHNRDDSSMASSLPFENQAESLLYPLENDEIDDMEDV